MNFFPLTFFSLSIVIKAATINDEKSLEIQQVLDEIILKAADNLNYATGAGIKEERDSSSTVLSEFELENDIGSNEGNEIVKEDFTVSIDNINNNNNTNNNELIDSFNSTTTTTTSTTTTITSNNIDSVKYEKEVKLVKPSEAPRNQLIMLSTNLLIVLFSIILICFLKNYEPRTE